MSGSKSNTASCGGLKIDSETLGVNSKGELFVKAISTNNGGDDDLSARVATEEEIDNVKNEIGQILDGD